MMSVSEARTAHGVVGDWVRTLIPAATFAVPADASCPALTWAQSGGMDLTGHADGPPLVSPAPAYDLLRAVVRAFEGVTGVAIDPAVVLSGRAGLLGWTRAGQQSAGGASRLIRTADGWCAITLSRPTDIDAVPAILGTSFSDDPWDRLATQAAKWSATELADRAQLLGVPAAPLALTPQLRTPWRTTRIADPVTNSDISGRLVVDLSSMWAGPLCAQLLGLAGARIIKVESEHRPDGARAGHPRFFEWLHGGHQFRTIDFRSDSGRAELRALLEAADAVIEASRPRALAQLGLAPAARPHRAGQVWLSLTGYGRDDPMRVAFGDDAAVAGGMVGWEDGNPMFCADAIADPLTGVCGALAVACSIRAGGGQLIDLSMQAVAEAFAAAPSLTHGPHPVRWNGNGWLVECEHEGRAQSVLPPSMQLRGA